MQKEVAQGRLVALKLKPADLFRPVCIVHRRRKVFSELALGLLEILRAEAPMAPAAQELVEAAV
jgi:hypothetical protein